MSDLPLDDLLDRLVADYSDKLLAGETPAHPEILGQVPPEARPGLERCLKMIDAGMAQVPGSQALARGARLGRYELLREIGRGGMALVWLARDRELDRPVALKILRPGLALEERHVDRFRREALAIAKLRHPHIVQIFDVGTEAGYHYLAMEYVEGPSLATVLEALRPLSPERRTAEAFARLAGAPSLAPRGASLENVAAGLLALVAEALNAAHEHGLVHRDVKPSNILLRKDGTPVVADFGLAKAEGDPALSMTGDTLGTPYYMSPEQAWLTDVQVDHRTDVYSLGVTLYESLSGRRPFEGETVLEVFEAIKTQMPAGLRSVSPAASKDAAAVVRRAMARDPERRYAGAAELAADLRSLAQGSPTQARQQEGSSLRRAWSLLRALFSGHPFEYRSQRTFLGLPLVHVITGRRWPGQKARAAKGWIAMGDIAYGGLVMGGLGIGAIAFGGIALGLFTWGGISLALLLGCGGIATGLLSFGGLSGGYLAFGGIALGYYAIGGFVRGVYAMGGNADGRYVITEGREDLTEEEFWENVFSFLG